MPLYDLQCAACGADYIDEWLRADEQKDCGCGGRLTRVWRTRAVIGDECDVVQENGFHHPTRFTSKAALKQALAEKGLEQHVRHVPIPGTDKSPHTTDWAKGCMDPTTLENARILTTRTGRTKSPTSAPPSLGTWTITVRE